ncbi:MAG: zinc ABC transporter substrate-binding protein [Erysipelotrichaceae bacterium]
MKKKISIITITILMIILSGCAPSKPTITTTVYPVEYLVKRIGGDYINVKSLSSSTMIQTSQINPDYNNILKDTDVLFYINGLEPYFDIYNKEITDECNNMVDLGLNSAIYKFNRYSRSYVNDQPVGLETDYYDGNTFNTIDKYNNDPMIWMDPIAMISMAKTVKEYLVEKYPEYGKAFNDNYSKLEAELARMDAEYQIINKERMNISFVSMSSSFGYWQKSYGIKVYPVIQSKYGAIPTDAQLELIKERIIKDNVKYIAYEPNMNDDMKKVYDELVADCKLMSINLNNINSITAEDTAANRDYMTLMYGNLSELESIAK